MARSSAPGEPLWNLRAQTVLHALIESYIRDGHPVSSRTLARSAGLGLSAATVRNVMADLESLGYIESPHVSSGRLPTVLGYRRFVDTMLEIKPLKKRELQRLRSNLDPDKAEHELCEEASELLSEFARMAGIVTVRRHSAARLKRVEFISLDERRVLAVLVLRSGEVENLILKMDREYSDAELVSYANYLNAHFANGDFEDVRKKVLSELRDLRAHINQVMVEALKLAGRMFKELPREGDCTVSGQTNLMRFEEFAQVDHLYRLFCVLNEKREVLKLFDKCAGEARGVRIFIGHESGCRALQGCSVVSAPYAVNNHVVGVLAVIGPTRMAYERIVPLVDITAKLLGQALKHNA